VSVVIVVPYRADRGHRDKLWGFCKARWRERHPDWRIYEGASPEGPFNRAAAVNDAVARATVDRPDWTAALIIDADVVCDPQACESAIATATQTGRMVVAHDRRVMVNRDGTDRILRDYTGPWDQPRFVERVWHDSVSCAVAVTRQLWDEVGGMDPAFVGWGYEDSAFEECAVAAAGPYLRVSAQTFHLWHKTSPEAADRAPTKAANWERLQLYRAASGDREALRALRLAVDLSPTRIPRILHRTLPAGDIAPEVDQWWLGWQQLLPGWKFQTWREPCEPDFPELADVLPHCIAGAQRAGLIRLAILVRDGGVYMDSDVSPVASLEPLLHVPAFAGWEDDNCLPDAVLGAEPGHPAFVAALASAIELVRNPTRGRTPDQQVWDSGPGVSTATLPGRPDVLCLPPGAFYPVHYLDKARLDEVAAQPPKGCFGIHQWHHSWGSASAKKALARRQRS
jgi:hypothetical protein